MNKIRYPEHWPIWGVCEGKTYFAWLEDLETWYPTEEARDTYGDPVPEDISRKLKERHEGLIAAREKDMAEILAARATAKQQKWDYLRYLEEVERAELAEDRRMGLGDGKPCPDEIEPSDAYHEPWVAARMG